MPYSHHSHSGQFCKHAAGTLEEVVLEAIKQGFEVYGLSEHAPRFDMQHLYPEEQGLSLADLTAQYDAFLHEAHRLKDFYAHEITLLVGLETESLGAADKAGLRALLERHAARVEYLVGSVHHVRGIPIDFDEETYARVLAQFAGPASASGSQGELNADAAHAQMDAFLCAYFDAQYDVLTTFHPEVVGHIDLCRLYTPQLRLEGYPAAWEKLRRNVAYAVEYGALFECNAAALRKGWETAYPGEDVAKVIIEEGGRFALSDDSHGTHAVALNYGPMARYLRKIGVDELWTLERSDVLNVGGRYTRPRKVQGTWWEHPFWKRIGVELQ